MGTRLECATRVLLNAAREKGGLPSLKNLVPLVDAEYGKVSGKSPESLYCLRQSLAVLRAAGVIDQTGKITEAGHSLMKAAVLSEARTALQERKAALEAVASDGLIDEQVLLEGLAKAREAIAQKYGLEPNDLE